jgi:hypothetical protein
MKEYNFQPVPHAAFSLELAPTDFHLFSGIKRRLRRRNFQETDELVEPVKEVFSGQGIS